MPANPFPSDRLTARCTQFRVERVTMKEFTYLSAAFLVELYLPQLPFVMSNPGFFLIFM